MALLSCHLPTPLGEMLAVASDQGLCLLEFVGQQRVERELAQVEAARGGPAQQGRNAILDQLAVELAEYFAGQRQIFGLPLDLVGTPFQVDAWQALLRIPYGRTRSYAEQARAIGRPTATRAVAAANGQNKVSIVVPCHRVIGSDGSLTGFGGGLPRKRALLALEGGAARLDCRPAGCIKAHNQTMSDHTTPATIAATPFTEAERAAVYRAIYERRDMRHFAGGTVPEEVLLRLLRAAHHAPSVGFMQPWRFIRVKSAELRQAIHALVEEERVRTAHALGEREEDFMKLKVQGVLDAAEVLVVAMPPGREAHIFGRRTLPEMDIASTACAIQNLWLAVRAEGLGMGWVSIFEPRALARLLHMPEGAHPLGVLCLGPVAAYYAEPMLQQEKWACRAPLEDMLMDDLWSEEPPAA